MPFGQLVVGPPGSGKTTYCNGLQQMYGLMKRKVAVVNLDPANDAPSYDCAVDIADLVSLESVQAEVGLGPNGGLIYCIDYLAQNLDWLQERLKPLEDEGCYLVIDCPGQVELFTLSTSFKAVVTALTDRWHYRLAAVQLVDAHLCADPGKYLSGLLLSLSTMLHLELPQVNVLSKFDLAEQYGEPELGMAFYLAAQGLEHLAAAAAARLPPRFARLTQDLCGLVEDFGLVQFSPLAVEDAESMAALVALVDKANGFVFAGLAQPGAALPELQYSAGVAEGGSDLWERMQERHLKPGGALPDVQERRAGGGGGSSSSPAGQPGSEPP